MPHEIIYPQGCRPVTEDLGADELIRRLKTLAHTLQAMGQDEGAYQQYIPLTLHLAEDHFLQHHSKDVQLLIACCIADVLRVYAPEAPYKDPEKVKTIFQFLIKQLAGLKDPKDPAFKRYFYLLENLAYVKSFNMCFELEDCQEIFCNLFGLMFKIVNDEHSGKVKSFMLDVLVPLITESDIVSNELLDIVLQNVVDPVKTQKKNAYLLAKELIIKTADTLEPYIQTFFNHVLIFGGKEEKGLTIYSKVFDLIYELNAICPSILLAVLPQLEVKLKSSNDDERLGAVSLLARMFSEKGSNLATAHQQLWRAFLGRFNDINVFIRIKCVQYSMHFLLNHPELRKDITETLKMRQHDSEETVRYEVVMAIVSTLKKDFEVVSHSEDLLEFVKERTLDKKFKIRKEAMSGLGMIYRIAQNELEDISNATKKAVTWIKDKILHGYYMTSMEDRLLVERLLNTSLVPFQLPPEERMRKLFHLLGTIDGNAMKAFLELQRHQLLARKTFTEWLEFHKKAPGADRSKDTDAKNAALAKFLPDQVKAQEFIHKLSVDIQKDSALLMGLERIVHPDISCKECAETTSLVLKKLGQPIMTNLYYNTIKMLLERVSSVMIDYEALKILIGYVEEVMRGGSLIEELGLDPITASERGLRMLMMMAYVFPAHFFHADIISHLVRLVKTEDPMVLSVLTFLGKYKPVFEQFGEVSEEHGLVPLCKEFAERGNPKHAKQAIRCLHINYGKAGLVEFTHILEKVRQNLVPESENYLTAIVAFGHIAQNLPNQFPAHIKNIVSRKIVKELLVKNTETESSLPLNEPWCSEEQLPFETRCKVEGLKAMARWLVGLKSDKLSAQKTFRMLSAFVAKKGDLLQTGKLSKAEMAWLRLAAGCAMLRICEQKGVGDQYFAEQFYTLSTLVNDESPEVREKFLNKLHKGLSRGLPARSLPLDFMGLYALCGLEDNRRIKSTAKQQMWAAVAKRRDHAKSLSVTHLSCIEKAMEELPRILPDYMLLFAIPVLTHCPAFTDPSDPAQLKAMRACLTHVLEPLLTKNDFYCFGFYKEMIDRAKNCTDAVSPDDELTNHKMWALCDLAMSLLLQKTTNFDYKDIQSETRIPAMYFKRNPDPLYVNTRLYIPLEFQYSGPVGSKKPAPLSSAGANRRPGKGKQRIVVTPLVNANTSNDAKPVTASETQIRLPGMESSSDGESSDPPGKKPRTRDT